MDKIKISKKLPRGDDGHSTITIRIPTYVLEQIENISAKTDRSRNQVITMLLAAAVENVVIEEE